MKVVECSIEGVAPLLHHRFPTEERGEETSKAKKKVYSPEEEARKALYTDENNHPVIPAEHVYSACVKAATSFIYEGKRTYKDIIKAGIIIEPEYFDIYDKNGNRKSSWDEIDARPVVVQKARVIRWRPRFNEWTASFKIVVLDDTNIPITTLKEIVDRAGRSGIGDYRPRFGRFIVTKWKEVDDVQQE